MTDEVERYSRRRRYILIGMALAFLIWQVAGFGIFDDFASGDRRAVRIVSVAAAILWAGMLVWLVAGKAMRGASAPARAALDDELVRANRAQAFAAGYWITLAVAAIVFAAALFADIEAHKAVQLILISAVVAPMFAFAWLEGRGG